MHEGITPARAGNSEKITTPRTHNADHPRACGEQKNLNLVFQFVQGSPPRVRGTGRGKVCNRGKCGITPARAGNSPLKECESLRCRDHPRACGEQLTTDTWVCARGGSPPRVRGTVPG